MILYHYGTNAILAEPCKSKDQRELVRAFTALHTYLEKRGHKPTSLILDNEAPPQLQTVLEEKGIKFQLVPPYVHRRNAAERAIQTYKNHFVSGLCSTPTNFPLHLWCRLLTQSTITLNLMRPSRNNPNLSAYAVLEGSFDFNRTPLAPPGVQVLVHQKTMQRKSWAPHALEGWYVGPAMKHYRCFTTYITKSSSERISDTVVFLPQQPHIPMLSKRDILTDAATTITEAIKQPAPKGLSPQFGDKKLVALQQLATLFRHAAVHQSQHRAQTQRVKSTPLLQQSPVT